MKQIFVTTLFLLFFLQSFSSLKKNRLDLESAYIEFKGNSMIASTGEIDRIWNLTETGWITKKIINHLSGTAHTNNAQLSCDWDLPGVITDSTLAEFIDFKLSINNDEGFTSNYIEAISTFRYSDAGIELQHVVWVYPNTSGIRTQLKVKALPGFNTERIAEEGLPKEELKTKTYGHTISIPSARVDYLPLDYHGKNSRRYWGYYNNPGSRLDASRRMLEEQVVKSYPVFLDEDNGWASGIAVEYGDEGICVVKESHKCVNQQGHNTGHFYSGPNGLKITGWGLTADEIIEDRFRECWATWTIAYDRGNDGMQLAIKRFDRARFPFFPERDMYLESATWGPANPGGRQFGADENYVLTEIPLLADLGVDIFRIDDGYHINPWKKGERFLPRYKDGWKNVKRESDKVGLELGLWIAAQRAKQEDILQNLDEINVRTWMVDFDHLNNRAAFENRFAQFREVMKKAWMKTQFAVCPEYDDPRYGWYYGKEYGCIYFQNLQEGLPVHLTMVPTHVLHQNWLMSKYLNANKLQANFQNPHRVNRDRSDANQHSISYCFALTFPFVPIFDNAAQYLNDTDYKELKQTISIYKKHREEMFSCYSFPIGELSTNESWSGYQFINEELTEGYLVIMREINNKETQKSIKLKFIKDKAIELTNVENGKEWIQKVDSDGMALFNIDQPASYIFLKYKIK